MANYYKEIENIIDKLIYKIMLKDKKGFNLGGGKGNLSFLELYIIKEIGIKKIDSIHSLVREMDIDRGIISSIIGRLTSKGYLIKERAQRDRRIQNIKLTDLGIKIYNQIISGQKEILDFILNDMTLNEERAILKFLSKLNQTFKFDINKKD